MQNTLSPSAREEIIELMSIQTALIIGTVIGTKDMPPEYHDVIFEGLKRMSRKVLSTGDIMVLDD